MSFFSGNNKYARSDNICYYTLYQNCAGVNPDVETMWDTDRLYPDTGGRVMTCHKTRHNCHDRVTNVTQLSGLQGLSSIYFFSRYSKIHFQVVVKKLKCIRYAFVLPLLVFFCFELTTDGSFTQGFILKICFYK